MNVNSRAAAADADRNVAAQEELQWVRRAREGDARALDWLVRSQWERVERLLRRILGPRQDLEDLVQNTFLETLRALPSYRGESALSTFVAGIAVRVARRAMRPSLVIRKSVPLEALVERGSAQSGGGEAQVQEAEALRRVRAILERVAEPKRVAFLLWALSGVETAEVAAIMGASVAATRSRIFYAQRELQRMSERDPYLQEWLKERAR
jgi:RNA polymerase sigma-70 factor (ECF subfamily)